MLGLITRGGLMRRLDAARIEEALREAEQRTSGEVRVSVAPFFWGSVERAADLAFERLQMRATQDRNGVLIFLVPSRRRFRLLGDEGIHARVGQAFWDGVAGAMSAHFHRGEFTEGLVEGIHTIGVGLAEHFPHAGEADRNELPDTIDFGDDGRRRR